MPGVTEALQRRIQPFVAAHRLGVYTVLSVAAVLAITVNALRSHSNFYSVTVYLSRSSRSLIVRILSWTAVSCANQAHP